MEFIRDAATGASFVLSSHLASFLPPSVVAAHFLAIKWAIWRNWPIVAPLSATLSCLPYTHYYREKIAPPNLSPLRALSTILRRSLHPNYSFSAHLLPVNCSEITREDYLWQRLVCEKIPRHLVSTWANRLFLLMSALSIGLSYHHQEIFQHCASLVWTLVGEGTSLPCRRHRT